jgi:hypothetical protein
VSRLNTTSRNECSKNDMDSNPAVKKSIKSTRQKGERRGRPYTHRGSAPQMKMEARHYTTIWQAELNYIYIVTDSTKAYSSDKY